MARAKKEAALMSEERLQATLVPDWEWPYKLPENWCWVHISDCCSSFSGKAPKYVKEQNNNLIIGQQANQEYGIDLKYAKYGEESFYQKSAPEQFLKPGDVLLNTLGTGTIGRSGYYNFEPNRILTDGHLFVFRTKGILLSKLLYFYFKKEQQHIIDSANGSTNQKFLSLSAVGEKGFPLPPLVEQQRIVDRIESLFAKLDEAKEKAQTVLDSFETRKAAILHKAFTGELTANWREEHDVGMESWEDASFESTIDKMQNGLAKRSGAKGKPYVVLRLANLSADGFNTDDLREILLDEKEQMNYELRSNDVIMVRVNGSKDNVGKQYLVTNQNNWAFCDHLIRIRYSEKVLPQYMTYFAQSEKYRLYVKDNIVSSAGQNTISRKGMANLFVPVPQNNEQLEIVRILDDLFAKEQQAKEAAEAILDQIDLMKKSILARAFRGELGTNDPADEPAVELLKKVLDLPAEPKPKAKRKFIPKELDAQIKNDLERKIIKAFIQNETDVLPIKQLMSVSSKKFDVMEALRNLQNRGILLKENDTYKLMG